MSYREDFSIKLPNPVKAVSGAAKTVAKGTTGAAGTVAKGTTGAAKIVAKGTTSVAGTVAKGVTGLPGTIFNKILGPVWDWLQRVWGWFRYVASLVCCLCVVSSCMALGVPQLLTS